MSAVLTGEVIIPSQAASTLIVAGVASSQVWLVATGGTATVFIGPAGVTPQTGFPLPLGTPIGPFNGAADIRGVVGEGQERGSSVRFIQTS